MFVITLSFTQNIDKFYVRFFMYKFYSNFAQTLFVQFTQMTVLYLSYAFC